MNLGKLQTIKHLDGYTYTKFEKSKVFMPNEVAKGIHNKVAPMFDRIEYAAQKLGKEAHFYPAKENVLFFKFGPYTSLIPNKLPKEDVEKIIKDHVAKTYEACELNAKMYK